MGFVINGQAASDESGYNVASAGDINGDGLVDLIIGARKADPAGGANAGRSYVVYGTTGTAAIDLSAIAAGSGGFVINGESAGDVSGRTVSAAGDINGDGYADLLVGAPNAGGTGRGYVIFGGPQFITGTVAQATGTSANEYVIGTNGNDTLVGGGGVDRFSGGDGNDTIVLTASDITNLVANGGSTRSTVDGGGDFDTLRLSGGASLNLTTISNVAAMSGERTSRINNIERIDMATDTAANTLTLSAQDVNDMAGMNLIRSGSVSADGATWANASGTALSSNTAYHQLVVDGTNADSMTLAAGVGGWFRMGSVSRTLGGSTSNYEVYQNDSTRSQVFVASGVGVTNDDPGGPLLPGVQLTSFTAGTTGMRINNNTNNEVAGSTVANAGDVNGDGIDDFILGTGPYIGRSYVVFGQTGTRSAPIELSDVLAGSGGFVINGVSSGANVYGTAVKGAGDVNGDGLADLLVSEPGFNGGNNGRAYVVFGKISGTAVSVTNVTSAVGGFTFIPEAGSNQGLTTDFSSAGDVNGDGLADIIVRAGTTDASGAGVSSVYVVFGRAGSQGNINLASIAAGSGGFVIRGYSDGRLNGGISNAGDVNGDGLSDLIVGVPTFPISGGGSAYVVYGKTNTNAIQISSFSSTASNGFVLLDGAAPNEGFGILVRAAGDVNGDGLADMIVSTATTGGASRSSVYVVFGKSNNSTTVNTTAMQAGSGGFAIVLDSGGYIGGVSAPVADGIGYAGDVNGDGLADMLVGVPTMTANGQANGSTTYVVFGKTGSGNVYASDLAKGSGGFAIYGGPGITNMGRTVSSAGDVNGDGYDDLILGANATGQKSDAVIIYGGPQFQAATVAGAGTVTGTSNSEAIVGSAADDTLTGGGGVDRFFGAAGNDTVVLTASDISNLASNSTGGARATVDGGGGFDTLRLSGGTNLDLTAITNVNAMSMNGSSRITSVERIDLATDTAANTLTLSATDVKDMAGFNLIHTGSVSADGRTWSSGTYTLGATMTYHQLVVEGDSNDVLSLKGASSNWASSGTVTNADGTYNVYTNSSTNAQVFVKSGVTVNLNVAPIVLDLNGDGVLSYTQQLMDVNGDGQMDFSAWAGRQDGVLVWNKFGDGLVHDQSQYAFTQYGGNTDLQGLAAGFDSNHDGVLDARDARFAEFGVWQDSNGNGLSDAGEFMSLSDLGVMAIHLTSDGVAATPATGVSEAGRTVVDMADGSTRVAADAAFTFNSLPVLDLNAVLNTSASGAPVANMADGKAEVLKLTAADVLNLPTNAAGLHQLEVLGDSSDVVDLKQFAANGSVTQHGHTFNVYQSTVDQTLQVLIDQQIAQSHVYLS
jgi:hypothetical protein